MLTIEPPLAVLIIAGMACLESRNIVSTLTCMTRRNSSGFSSTTLPRLPMPTLLSRKSSRPQRSTAASTRRLHSASLVTSPAWETAVPPSPLIISTVRSASFWLRSATTTLVPARASRIAAARPLPMPSAAAPPPDTIATLPVKPASSSGPFIAPPSVERVSGPAHPWHIHPHDLDAPVALVRDRRAAAAVGDDEQSAPVGAAQHAGVGAARCEIEAVRDLAALQHAHDATPERIADPDGILGIEADAVGIAAVDLGPQAASGE